MNLNRSLILVPLAVVGVMLASLACSTVKPQRGMMSGEWSKPNSSEIELVKISYSSNEAHGGVVNITLGEGGERFRGDFVRISKESQGRPIRGNIMSSWGTLWGQTHQEGEIDPWTRGVVDAPASREGGSGWDFYLRKHYSGRVIAFLTGDRGNSMRCRMELKNPAEGMSGGGSGECEVSDDSEINIRF